MLENYTDEQRQIDYRYFKENDRKFFSEYGHKYLAIKNEKLLFASETIPELIEKLSSEYEVGSYIIQECEGNAPDYANQVMRLIIGAEK